MKSHTPTLLLALILCVLISCATGQNAFDRGNYEIALDRAVRRLQSNPNNKKAQRVLLNGYQTASRFHLNRITQIKQSGDPRKWEGIFSEYSRLNKYYQDIQRCPACMDLVQPQAYFQEQENAGISAAKALVDLGNGALELKTIEGGREAYRFYRQALNFDNRLGNIDSLLETAMYMGTLRVLIEPIPIHSRNLEITNEYFENKLFEYLSRFGQGHFVRFMTPDEIRQTQEEPDHVLLLQFDDFVLGQAEIVSKTVEIKRDSVIVGEFEDKEGVKHDVFGTVKADYTRNQKTLYSSGVLNFEIRDAYTSKVLTNRKLASEDVWQYEWASFNGDERALTKEEIKLAKLNEIPPPSPQALFISFIDRIYGQIEGNVRQFYRNTQF